MITGQPLRTPARPPSGSSAPDAEHNRRCAVCNHDLADHDSIGLRYCQATRSQALSRACICR